MKSKLMLCAALAFAPVLHAAGPPTEDLIAGSDSGPWRRVFLDGAAVEAQGGLERVFHTPTKHPANPLIVKDKPWEGRPGRSGPYLYGTVMWDEGKLRMWYQLGDGGNRIGYAESQDGLDWVKPSLGLIEFEGSTDNNLCLFLGPEDEQPAPRKHRSGQCHNPSVIKQTWEKNPEKRYALYTYGPDHGKARVAFSPDGLGWTFVPGTAEKALFSSADVINYFRDPYRKRFVATVKCGSRRGRAATVAFSDDGLEWVRPLREPIFAADDLDNDITQIYGMPVFPYQGLYIGQPWIYHARWFKEGRYTDAKMGEAEKGSSCLADVQLAWSWDLFNWTRPPKREPFLPLGPEGTFDSGMIFTAIAPVQMGDELWFYYGGFDGPHNTSQRNAAIGVATLRLDGFCSMRAKGKEGWLITRREAFATPAVSLNARTGEGGAIVAEILDRNDQVLEGFSREDCFPFTGDGVRHRLAWEKTDFDEAQREGDKKIRFFLRDAELFSYQPVDLAAPAE